MGLIKRLTRYVHLLISANSIVKHLSHTCCALLPSLTYMRVFCTNSIAAVMEEAAAAAAAEAAAAADASTGSPLSSSLHGFIAGDADGTASSSTAPSSPVVKRRHMSSLSASVAPKRRSSVVAFSSSKEATAIAMERIVLPLERLAETHFQGGIRAHHYQSLGDALTHALR
jgi:hypothetical protein